MRYIATIAEAKYFGVPIGSLSGHLFEFVGQHVFEFEGRCVL